MSWLSPAFPVGAYSYSHGLEYAIEMGLVSDRATLEDWIAGILRHGTGRVDAMLFKAAYECAYGDLNTVAELAFAMRGTSELAQESHSQGRAFLRAVDAAWGTGLPESESTTAVSYVVSVATTCKTHCIPLDMAMIAYLQAFASNLVSAGVRLIPIGQTDGQITIANLEGVISEVVEAAMQSSLDDLGSSTPMVDWASMKHENQYTRLFRS